jgi:hypothetical protein
MTAMTSVVEKVLWPGTGADIARIGSCQLAAYVNSVILPYQVLQ